MREEPENIQEEKGCRPDPLMRHTPLPVEGVWTSTLREVASVPRKALEGAPHLNEGVKQGRGHGGHSPEGRGKEIPGQRPGRQTAIGRVEEWRPRREETIRGLRRR